MKMGFVRIAAIHATFFMLSGCELLDLQKSQPARFYSECSERPADDFLELQYAWHASWMESYEIFFEGTGAAKVAQHRGGNLFSDPRSQPLIGITGRIIGSKNRCLVEFETLGIAAYSVELWYQMTGMGVTLPNDLLESFADPEVRERFSQTAVFISISVPVDDAVYDESFVLFDDQVIDLVFDGYPG